MPPVSDHYQYLFLGKITNSLSVEEDRELQELFARDGQALDAYNDLVGQLPRQQVDQSFSHLNTPGFWKNISGEIREQDRLVLGRRIIRASAAVVCIGAIVVGGWFVLRPAPPASSDRAGLEKVVAAARRGRAVELRMADGSSVDLSAVKGNVQQGGMILDNSGHALSYSASSGGAAVGFNTVDVPVGMDYKINLSDGSEVWLNSMSSVRFPSTFAANEREITVTGEVYCKVAKRANQPFIVHLPSGSSVEVTGTEFNVNTYRPGMVKVALVDGGVNLVEGGKKMKVEPGNQAVAEGGALAGQAPFQAERVLGWRQGLYAFEAADLDEISAVLGRWFGVKTHLDDASLGSKKFTGALNKNRPLSSFLDNFEVISHIDTYLDATGVLHFAVKG